MRTLLISALLAVACVMPTRAQQPGPPGLGSPGLHPTATGPTTKTMPAGSGLEASKSTGSVAGWENAGTVPGSPNRAPSQPADARLRSPALCIAQQSGNGCP
jgi:hypothetical protein